MLRNIVMVAGMGALIVSCSMMGKDADQPVASAPAVQPAPTPEPANVEPPAPTPVTPVVSNHNSVYFAFNQYDIRDDYRGIIKANSDYLTAHADAKLQVQGNTDDIGSVEYNLSLGQKRADAVRQALVADGADGSKIEAVSYGKLKAKYPNDNDANRASNRRSDMVYKSGKPQGYSLDNMSLPIVDGSFFTGTVTEGIQ